MIVTMFALVALAILCGLIWGSVPAACFILWRALGDLYGPHAEPVIPCTPEPASEPAGASPATTEAQERAWAGEWAARSGG